MQTFLPYLCFDKSAASLDPVRLRKQRLEAFQILSALRDPITLEYRLERGLSPPKGSGWVNHPACVMWRGYEEALRLYYNAMVHNRPSGTLRKLDVDCNSVVVPIWLYEEELQASHRSRLHYKGTIDCLSSRIKSQSGVRSAKTWLKSVNLPEMNVLTRSQRDRANSILDSLNVPPSKIPNFYDQFDWSEANTYMPYLWPEKSSSAKLRVGTKYDH